ncbi:MAG: hypothetical protein EZS28_000422 [Streblomastix strix]|uniref:Uncharacterized protein n=1 Tax=Streblomastix strix TaxID=222440 RepID=A0A5J4XA97_9EUKA|nr:MAG: hypothetical protein EZS28_000417 [Streblomastix strix]KAA6404055.1 MAG: hypothetical protein EZS28_000422 [Streblomastix strix]
MVRQRQYYCGVLKTQSGSGKRKELQNGFCSLLFFIFIVIKFLLSSAKHYFTSHNAVLVIVLLFYVGGIRVECESINLNTTDIIFQEFGYCGRSNGIDRVCPDNAGRLFYCPYGFANIISLDILLYMADHPEFLGFISDIWFSVSEPQLEPTQRAESLIRDFADFEFCDSLESLQNS